MTDLGFQLMRKLLATLLATISSLIVSAVPSIYVKFCSNDCATCNLPLMYLLDQLNTSDVKVVFPETEIDDRELIKMQQIIVQKGGRVLFSNALFHKFDSGSRSLVIVADKDRVLYKSILKSASIPEIRRIILESESDQAKQFGLLPELEKYHLTFQMDSDFLVFNLLKPYSLLVSKSAPDKVKDSIYFVSEAIKEAILRKRFGDSYTTQIKAYDSLYQDKPYKVPQISCIQLNIQGNKIYAFYSYKYVHKASQLPLAATGLRIENEPAILTLSSEGKILDIEDFSVCDAKGAYSIGMGGYFRFAGSEFMCLHRNDIGVNDNHVVGKLARKSDRIVIDTAFGDLSSYQKLSGQGYHASFTLKQSNGYFVSTTDNHLYNCRNFNRHKLSFIPDHTSPSSKWTSFIQDLQVDTISRTATILYTFADSMYLAQCLIDNQGPILKEKRALWHKSLTEEAWISEKGIYRYLPAKKRFDFVPQTFSSAGKK